MKYTSNLFTEEQKARYEMMLENMAPEDVNILNRVLATRNNGGFNLGILFSGISLLTVYAIERGIDKIFAIKMNK